MRLSATVMLAASCLGASAYAQSGPPAGLQMGAPILRQVSKDAVADGPAKEVRVFHDTLPAGAVTPWHTHDASPIFYVVRGSFSLEFKDRPDVLVQAGEAFVEPVGVALRGRAAADAQTEFVIVQVSDPAKPFLHPAGP